MSDYIRCLICNEKIIKDKKKFRTHTRARHKVYIYDYEQMYTKDELEGSEFIFNKKKNYCSLMNRGKVLAKDPSSRKKSRPYNLDKYSLERIKRSGIERRGKFKSWNFGLKTGPPWNKGIPMSDEQRTLLSKIHTEKVLRGDHCRKNLIDYTFCGKKIRLQSKLELLFLENIKHLESIFDDFDYEFTHIKYIGSDGRIHRTIPDFYFKYFDRERVVEVKNPYLLEIKDPETMLKIYAAKRYFTEEDINYSVITNKEIKDEAYLKNLFR